MKFFFVFAVCSTKAHGKGLCVAVCQRGHTANRDWRDVRPSVDGSRGVRRVSTDWHTAKMGVRRVPSPGTRQTITDVRPPDGRGVCPARDPCSPCAYWLTHGEEQGLPCAGPWHTAKSKVSRVFFSLPCVLLATHGKGGLRRVPEIMHTVKILAHGKIPFSGSALGVALARC